MIALAVALLALGVALGALVGSAHHLAALRDRLDALEYQPPPVIHTCAHGYVEPCDICARMRSHGTAWVSMEGHPAGPAKLEYHPDPMRP